MKLTKNANLPNNLAQNVHFWSPCSSLQKPNFTIIFLQSSERYRRHSKIIRNRSLSCFALSPNEMLSGTVVAWSTKSRSLTLAGFITILHRISHYCKEEANYNDDDMLQCANSATFQFPQSIHAAAVSLTLASVIRDTQSSLEGHFARRSMRGRR